MFCKSCGTQLDDDAKFCENCGAATDNAPAAAAPATVGPNPMFTNSVESLKSFVKNPISAIGNAAKTNTMEWVVFAVIGVLIYALGNAVVGLESVAKELGEYAKYVKLGDIYPFFGNFAKGLLVGAVAFGAAAGGLWVLITSIFKKQIAFTQMLNMVGLASVPLTAVYVLNMLLGLIYMPLTSILVSVAFVMVIVLLYVGIKEFAESDSQVFYGFSAVMAFVVIAVRLLAMIYKLTK